MEERSASESGKSVWDLLGSQERCTRTRRSLFQTESELSSSSSSSSSDESFEFKSQQQQSIEESTVNYDRGRGMQNLWNNKERSFASNCPKSKENLLQRECQGSVNEDSPNICYTFLGSSIYYGGPDLYYEQPPKTKAEGHLWTNTEKSEDDETLSNLTIASRGNWWQGSLYY